MSKVDYERNGWIGVATINRPEALNVLDAEVVTELAALLEELAASDVRCVVVTGAGEKSFVAGADIGAMAGFDQAQATRLCRDGNAVMRGLETLPAPVIAAVNGFALGGGLELALACDIRLAADNASFALPEASLGVIPGYGGIQRLARIVGPGRARELVFSARRLKAEEALRIGLVNSVHAQTDLMPAAMDLAGRIAANAPFAVRAAKRVFNAAPETPGDASEPGECGEFTACFGTRDQREAMRAFVEKRKPEPFVGS